MAQCAGRMNKADLKKNYAQRAQSWRNLFDPTTKFFRARSNNAFVEPFAPEEVNFHFTEANAWQYSLYAPHDLNGLITAHGGDESFAARLDELFAASSKTSGREQVDITGLIGQYAHGNEPSHHVAYLYAYTGKPWKTADRVSEICSKFYTDAPDGLCGNEDCGQMSAWYVMSALGFYPVCPGTNEYALGMPQFEEIELRLENGKKVSIRSNPKTSGAHIVSATWNAQNWPNSFITHAMLMQGGSLLLNVNQTAEPNWGRAIVNRPHTSMPEELRYPLTPRIANTSARTFSDVMRIELVSDAGTKIVYSLNGQAWEAYAQPLVLREPARLQTYAVFENGLSSDTAFAEFIKSPGWKSVAYESLYAQQYAAGGALGLID
ncbi:MAG: GH92 family glycosyl hydrolase, partial [Bacteroidia bacterium]